MNSLLHLRNLAIVTGLLAISIAGARAEEPDSARFLLRDPFKKPSLAPSPGKSTESSLQRRLVKEPWEPELKAILDSGKSSLVNVDGVILGLGESYQDHRVLHIRAQEVVFVDERGVQRTLTLD